MSIMDKVLYGILNGKRTIINPIFIKEFKKENQQLNDLIKISNRVLTDKKTLIDRDIAFLKYGLEGEQNVYYELKNSFIPMLCLHDIRLEYNGYIAQFDFVVITGKFIYVLETKKLNGDVEITSDGDFIRYFKTSSGKVIKKEGMYSPIVQNERHVKILREILTKEGLIKTLPIKSAIIMSNQKTIINKRRCPKSIKNNIYKYDQITNLLKNELASKENYKNMLEKYMYEIAYYLVKNNKPLRIDYMSKYSLDESDFNNVTKDEDSIIKENLNNQDVYKLLKEYRLKVSKKEEIKAYMVFTNKELEALLEAKPKSKEQLLEVKGFGNKKVGKYGQDIIDIINRNINKNPL